MKKERPKKIIIASYGKATMVLCDGEFYGHGITGIDFHHSAGESPVLSVTCDRLPLLPEDGPPERIESFRKFLEGLMQGGAQGGGESPPGDEGDA